ncbi:MAG: hypothetical protein FJ335_08920 [Sphingomonadales bacterium]|nr:hypothetical protein [Sphingomonadales bacterium]
MPQDDDQQTIAAEALDTKAAGAQSHRPENDDHANEGIVSTPHLDQAPSGAFDAEGHRPVLERSRKVR